MQDGGKAEEYESAFMKPTMLLSVLGIGLKVLNLLLSPYNLLLTGLVALQIRDNRPHDSAILIPGSIAFIAWFGFAVGLFSKKYWAWLGTVISMPLSALALGWLVFEYEFMPNLPFVCRARTVGLQSSLNYLCPVDFENQNN